MDPFEEHRQATAIAIATIVEAEAVAEEEEDAISSGYYRSSELESEEEIMAPSTKKKAQSNRSQSPGAELAASMSSLNIVHQYSLWMGLCPGGCSQQDGKAVGMKLKMQ